MVFFHHLVLAGNTLLYILCVLRVYRPYFNVKSWRKVYFPLRKTKYSEAGQEDYSTAVQNETCLCRCWHRKGVARASRCRNTRRALQRGPQNAWTARFSSSKSKSYIFANRRIWCPPDWMYQRVHPMFGFHAPVSLQRGEKAHGKHMVCSRRTRTIFHQLPLDSFRIQTAIRKRDSRRILAGNHTQFSPEALYTRQRTRSLTLPQLLRRGRSKRKRWGSSSKIVTEANTEVC